MKLASLKHGRDGRLCLVSRDLAHMLPVDNLIPTLQLALDSWVVAAPKLQAAYDALNAGQAGAALPYDPTKLAAPLPRAYQWCDGSAYLNHVELVRKARGAQMPPEFLHDPLMYQGGSDDFTPPTADILVADEAYGIDLEGEVAAITDDVPMGISPAAAAGHIKLLMLVNDVSLRNLIPNELAKGFGFFHGKPATTFSPLAVTPDELGDAWRDNKIHLPLVSHINGVKFGAPQAGDDMQFSLADLIAHAAKTRNLRAGCIVGSGTVSNRDASRGFSCLAEIRMIETINEGKPKTPFMKFGDRVHIEMLDKAGRSIFGAIDQTVVKYTPPAS
ncbi:fumarylacetoacetate hydrolase family protein [Ferrovibrio sp.]|uniref:fumarylacetoacetate hydrolase family protein n=1 Tax=Ferrovibrio sp. TaxID=1917215 RepID=UPI001B51CAC0|nr:fumarylacetoacetate hydrolase family protein [Ferrovibrio sp.]MBP7064558.1 fumarylacetoacetate hydrolase family protein [Ferrovibrio sp.]